MAAKKKTQKKPYKKPALKTTKRKAAPKRSTHSKATPAEVRPVAPATLVPTPDSELAPLATSSAQMFAQVELLRLATQEDAVQAGRMLVQLKGVSGQVEAKRKYLTAPLREHIKRIDAMFKPVTERLEHADQLLRQKLLVYQQAEAARQAEERAKLLAEATEAQEQGDGDTALALATQATAMDAAPRTTHVEDGSVQTKKVWDFEVEDMGRVPSEYFTLDEKKVRAAIRSGLREVPGLRIFQREQLAVSVTAAPVEPVESLGAF